MKLYGVERYGEHAVIEKEFARVTERFAVTDNGHRVALRGSYENWFQTPEEAIEHGRGVLINQVRATAESLSRAKDALFVFESIHPKASQ